MYSLARPTSLHDYDFYSTQPALARFFKKKNRLPLASSQKLGVPNLLNVFQKDTLSGFNFAWAAF